MTVQFYRDLGNGNVETLGILYLESKAAARAVAIALATYGGGIVTGREHGVIVASASGPAAQRSEEETR